MQTQESLGNVLLTPELTSLWWEKLEQDVNGGDGEVECWLVLYNICISGCLLPVAWRQVWTTNCKLSSRCCCWREMRGGHRLAGFSRPATFSGDQSWSLVLHSSSSTSNPVLLSLTQFSGGQMSLQFQAGAMSVSAGGSEAGEHRGLSSLSPGCGWWWGLATPWNAGLSCWPHQ